MSASLVGSEMCIRDSAVPVLLVSAGVQAQLHFRAVRQRDLRAQRGWEPVSYTHLTLPTICSV
eukprot:9052221-Alexandrium_andersonii.AAC.1